MVGWATSLRFSRPCVPLGFGKVSQPTYVAQPLGGGNHCLVSPSGLPHPANAIGVIVGDFPSPPICPPFQRNVGPPYLGLLRGPRWSISLLLLGVTALSSGCRGLPWRQPSEGVAASLTTSLIDKTVYRLRVGDDLEVSVWGPVDINRKVQIQEDGTIVLPLAGNLQAAGRSLKEIEVELQEMVTRLYSSLTSQSGSPMGPGAQQVLTAKEVQSELYHLRLGDELAVSVWGHEDLSRKVQIREDGSFSFPLIGSVKAAGRSLEEIEKELQERLGRDYIVNPQVTVWLSGAKFSVLGEVERPGSYPLEGTVDLLTAVSLAGGMTQQGSNHIEIIRILGKEKIAIRTRLDLLLQGLEPTIAILPRDTIYLKQSPTESLAVSVRLVGAKFSVLGEVERPGSYPLEGTVDLLTAISQAGGITKFGSHRVEIIRADEQEKLSIRANLNRVLQGKEHNLKIMPRDTIYVRRRLF